jgi:hypothetical protein
MGNFKALPQNPLAGIENTNILGEEPSENEGALMTKL